MRSSRSNRKLNRKIRAFWITIGTLAFAAFAMNGCKGLESLGAPKYNVTVHNPTPLTVVMFAKGREFETKVPPQSAPRLRLVEGTCDAYCLEERNRYIDYPTGGTAPAMNGVLTLSFKVHEQLIETLSWRARDGSEILVAIEMLPNGHIIVR